MQKVMGIIVVCVAILALVVSGLIFLNIGKDKYVEHKTTTAAIEVNNQEICRDDKYQTYMPDDVIKMEDTVDNQDLGYVYIPKTDTYSAFVTGTNDDNQTAMDDGSTATNNDYYLPGEGNHIIASGHRNLHMQDLYALELGDPIVIVIGQNVYVYEVTNIAVVDETDSAAVYYETDEELLTLYTCYPAEYLSAITGRYVVDAELVEASIQNCNEIQ